MSTPLTRTRRKWSSRLKNRETQSGEQGAASGERVPEEGSRLACQGTTVTEASAISGPRRRLLPYFLDVPVVRRVETRVLLLA